MFWLPILLTVTLIVAACFAFLNALTAPRLPNPTKTDRTLRVSLLIPARNELANLKYLLPAIGKLDHEKLEIILLDDHSEDGTGDFAKIFGDSLMHSLSQTKNPKNWTFQVIQGRPLPKDWIGKPWACHQLSQAATADFLIFCDADVRPNSGSVSATIAAFRKYSTDAVSAMPRNEMGTWAEKAVLPVLLHLSLLCGLPLALIPRFKMTALSAGNGQWFAFRRSAYDKIQGHTSVRARIVEDMALARRIKECGLRLALCLAPHQLSVRMYNNFTEVRNGFGKNLFYLMGTGWLQPIFITLFFIWMWVLPWLGFFFAPLHYAAALVALLLVRIITAITFHEHWTATLWHPMGSLLVPAIGWRSWRQARLGQLTWKGRNLPSPGPNSDDDFFAIKRKQP